MTRESVLAILKANKELLIHSMGVKSIGIFGSVARGEARPESDIDIIVDLDAPDFLHLMTIKIYLENQLGHPVDLVRKGPHLKKQFLDTIEPEIIYA